MLNEYNEQLLADGQNRNAGVDSDTSVEDVFQSHTDIENALAAKQTAYETAVSDGDAVMESMEAYVSSFTASCAPREWTRNIASQYQVGMTAILTARNINVPLGEYAPSFEAVDVKETAEDYHVTAMQKVKAFFAKIWAAISGAVTALYATFTAWRENQKKKADAVRAAANTLDSMMKNNKKDAGRVNIFSGMFGNQSDVFEKVAVSNANYVQYNGKLTSPALCLNILTKTVSEFTTAWHDGHALALDGAIAALAANTAGNFDAAKAKVLSYDGGVQIPGERTLQVIASGKSNALNCLKHASISVSPMSANPTGVNGNEIEILGSGDVIALITSMRATADYMDTVEKGLGGIQSGVNTKLAAIKTAMDKAALSDEVTDAKILAAAIGPLSVNVPKAHTQLTPILGEYAQLAFAHAKKSIAMWVKYSKRK